jgi:AcrR family transcriptional regulator
MPPKQHYSREAIVDTAFAITRRNGWLAVSARSIAQELSASTQPIYSYLESMKKLADEVRLRAMLLLAEYQVRPFTDNPYMNMGIGYIAFAREESNLFRFLYLEEAHPLLPDEKTSMDEAIVRHLGKPLPMKAYFGKISLDGFNDIALKTWLFTHGLAVALCTGSMEPVTDERIRQLIEETAEAIVTRQNRLDDETPHNAEE